MAEQEGITKKKGKDFSEWYNETVLKGGLADFSSVKGFMFIRPYGYSIWERILKILNRMLRETGHSNAYSPALIPERFIKKEKEHVEGFSPELFIVTQSGSQPLEEKLILRPTSETVIYDAYSRWVRSWRDLPILYNYWNSVFRAEIKMTKLFLRTCEFLWQEGHTVHATEKEADREVFLILDLYKKLMEEHLCIPVLSGKKTEKEKFAGASYTTTLEALMPDGKALQMGTSHSLGQNFSRPFNITFLDRNQKRQRAWQTSWGFSSRLIGALVMLHGDDKGLVLPPGVAPVQVVIVPIYKGNTREGVLKESEKLAKKLKFRTEVDRRDSYTPGWKFNYWEMKGVPLRIEIGPRDIKKKQVILARRDTGKKGPVKISILEKEIENALSEIRKSLLRKARKFLEANIRQAASLKEFQKLLKTKRGFLVGGWCRSRTCEDKIKEKTTADIRLVPFRPKPGKCLVCGRKGIKVYFAKAY
jgi:prolyl-tRNA synthetase